VTEPRTNDALASKSVEKLTELRGPVAQNFACGRAHGTKLANLEFHSQIRSID